MHFRNVFTSGNNVKFRIKMIFLYACLVFDGFKDINLNHLKPHHHFLYEILDKFHLNYLHFSTLEVSNGEIVM